MDLKIFKPNVWNVSISIILSIIYYYFTLVEIRSKCQIICNGNSYRSYSFLFGGCGQTCSPVESYSSILISLLFLPLCYILVSMVVSMLRKPQ